jgi:hypothetical protein
MLRERRGSGTTTLPSSPPSLLPAEPGAPASDSARFSAPAALLIFHPTEQHRHRRVLHDGQSPPPSWRPCRRRRGGVVRRCREPPEIGPRASAAPAEKISSRRSSGRGRMLEEATGAKRASTVPFGLGFRRGTAYGGELSLKRSSQISQQAREMPHQ